MAKVTTGRVWVPEPIHARLTAIRAELKAELGREVSYGETVEVLVREHEQARAAKAGQP